MSRGTDFAPGTYQLWTYTVHRPLGPNAGPEVAITGQCAEIEYCEKEDKVYIHGLFEVIKP